MERDPNTTSTTWIFVRLKTRLVINGIRRSTKTKWKKISFALSLVAALGAAALGVAYGLNLRGQPDPEVLRRMVVIPASAIVFGWWFAPLISGGVDETIDPARLSLIPLSRSEIRRGQVAAGFIGIAPIVMIVWMAGLVIGMANGLASVPLLVVDAVLLLLMALVGSRSIATSFARLSRSRRGGDLAALFAVVGGSAIFGGMQLIRFMSAEQFESVTSVLRWTPPGLAGDALMFVAEHRYIDALWRMALASSVIVVAGWWWSGQLDRLLTESNDARGDSISSPADMWCNGLPIFAGLRRFLPRTPKGASAAREMIYLVRSPGRRASLLAGTILGLVYVAFFAFNGDGRSPTLVLAAPTGMLFALQYASNQLGVDPGAFWIEVVAGPEPAARWTGRQLLGIVSVVVPVTVSAVILAVWTGGWVEFAAVMITMSTASFSMIGVGSLLSPAFVTPLPDSGNPFGTRQSMSGTGCAAGLIGMVYLLFVAVFVIPPEFAIRWAWRNQPWYVTLAIILATVGLNFLVWRQSTKLAVHRLVEDELQVLEKLDARLNV